MENGIEVQVGEGYEELVDAEDLTRVASAAFALEGHPEAEATIVLVSDEEMAALNLQYRQVDGPTDVLSFAAQEPAPGFVSSPEASTYYGDIVIAVPFTQRQAESVGKTLAEEFRLLVAHGVLHLLGYDHAEPEEEALMWSRQDAILAGLT